jgi:hypothetical protein
MFTIAPLNVVSEIRDGAHSVHIPVAVVGFWSRDPISIRVSRDYDWAASRAARIESGDPDAEVAKWKVEVSHSSGGRHTDSVPDDLDAETNFGAALIAAAGYARTLRERAPEFEAARNEFRVAEKARREAEERAQAEREAADPPMGFVAAKALLDGLTGNAAPFSPVQQGVFPRGADRLEWFTVERTRSGRFTFRINGNVTPKSVLIEWIAAKSARNNLAA